MSFAEPQPWPCGVAGGGGVPESVGVPPACRRACRHPGCLRCLARQSWGERVPAGSHCLHSTIGEGSGQVGVGGDPWEQLSCSPAGVVVPSWERFFNILVRGHPFWGHPFPGGFSGGSALRLVRARAGAVIVPPSQPRLLPFPWALAPIIASAAQSSPSPRCRPLLGTITWDPREPDLPRPLPGEPAARRRAARAMLG